MAQRSRLSPQTEPDEIRAARVEDAPSHLATARPGRAPCTRAARLRAGGGIGALCRGHARTLTLQVGVFGVSRTTDRHR